MFYAAEHITVDGFKINDKKVTIAIGHNGIHVITIIYKG